MEEITRQDMEGLFNLVEGIEYPIHFLAGTNQQVGGVRYYYHNAPPNFLYFLKAVPFVPNFYRWGMSQKNLFPIHEEERTIRDVSVYTPQGKRNKIFKDLMLNLNNDFLDRRLPVATPKMKLLPPQVPSPQRTPVSGNYNSIGTDIKFDSFLDPSIVAKLKYKPQMYNVQPEEAIGWVLFTDPNITQPINQAKVFYYNPFGYAYNSQNRYGCKYVGNIPAKEPMNNDIVDLGMVMLGIDPKKNPMVKKILAYDIAKRLEQQGIKVVQSGNKLIIHFTPSMFTGNIFGKWAKKIVEAVRDAGRKFEKYVTSPVRDYLKKKAPGIWNVFEKLEKKLDWKNITKKYNKTVDKLVDKYGAKLVEYGLMAGANYAGGQWGGHLGLTGEQVKNATRGLIKAGEKIYKGDTSALLSMATDSVSLSDIASGNLKDITGKILTNIKGQMIEAKGKEGVNDWNEFQGVLGNMLKDGKEQVKKIVDEDISKKLPNLARNSDAYKSIYSAFFEKGKAPTLKESEIKSYQSKKADFDKKKAEAEAKVKKMNEEISNDIKDKAKSIRYRGMTKDEALDRYQSYKYLPSSLTPEGFESEEKILRYFDEETDKLNKSAKWVKLKDVFSLVEPKKEGATQIMKKATGKDLIKYNGKTYDEAIDLANKWEKVTSIYTQIPKAWQLPTIQKYFDKQYADSKLVIPADKKKLFGKTYDEAMKYASDLLKNQTASSKAIPFYWNEMWIKDYFDKYRKNNMG